MSKMMFCVLLCLAAAANAAEPTFEKLLADSREYLNQQQKKLDQDFALSSHERWNIDQETGELSFSNKGKVAVVAKVQFVGSISTTSDTWLWSWANSSVLPTLTVEIAKVRDYGEQRHFDALTQRKWEADLDDGWNMAAITNYLLKAKGVYRAPAGEIYVFLVITDIRKAE